MLSSLLDLGSALTMAAGRNSLARRMAEVADLKPEDRALDIGCGPGNAVRLSADRVSQITGVDPTPMMLRVAGWLTRRHPERARIRYELGAAEELPLPDDDVTVAWTIASLHHWSDAKAGLREMHRVLQPGGQGLVVERVIGDGRGRSSRHGLSEAEAAEVADELDAVGFTGVRTDVIAVGRRRYSIIRGIA